MANNNLNINRKLENPAMRELLAKRKGLDPAKNDDVKEVMGRLINEIVMNARFLTVVSFDKKPLLADDGTVDLQDDTNINFTMLNNTNNEHFFPVFSENAELEKWENAKVENTVQVTFDNIAAMVVSNKNCGGFVINPFSDNMTISREITVKWLEKKQMMVKGHAQHVISPDSKYEFHSLNPYPMLLSNKLCETAKSLPINKMWLRGITLEGSDGYLLAVDFTGDRMETFTQLGNSARQFLGDKSLHMIDCKEQFGKIATENNIPIYSKD
ncbi:MAG: enhanced serine sensitivity protein SseB [Ruminococcaceae bacterium]|nr:enhanced serine sensitivity protein SseB [Oscillospiraceae bacterium]